MLLRAGNRKSNQGIHPRISKKKRSNSLLVSRGRFRRRSPPNKINNKDAQPLRQGQSEEGNGND